MFSPLIWILLLIVIFNCLNYEINGLKESVRRIKNEADCRNELMSPTYLADDQFSASSYSHNNKIYRPSAARLTNIYSQMGPSDGRAWCPEKVADKDIDEWIQVDFKRMTVICQIFTMGRGDGNFQRFTPQILIKYQRTDNGPWYIHKEKQNKEGIIAINTDARSQLRYTLQTIIAKRIKIYPLSITNPSSVCLKFALLGCFIEDGVVSYTAPQGDLVHLDGILVDLRDDVYDGKMSSTLTNGLGLLMDNIAWRKKFDLSKDLKDRQISVFTGWSCKENRRHSSINITFNFEQEREFSSLTLYSVRDLRYKVFISGPVVVSLGHNGVYSHITINSSLLGQGDPDLDEFLITIQLNHIIGDTCTITFACEYDNLIVLSEIEIDTIAAKSVKTAADGDVSKSLKQPSIYYFNATDKQTSSIYPDYQSKNSVWKQQNITIVAMTVLVILLLIFIIGTTVMCLKLQKSRRHKLTKKLELVAQCNNHTMCNANSGTVFTIQSKTPAISSLKQPKYFNETKTAYSTAYSGSQPSDGVYASWPNTDEDGDVATLDKEEEKCLLTAELAERSSVKEYATYQCTANPYGTNDYVITDNSILRQNMKSRPSSIVTTIPNLSTLSVPLLKIVTSYETPKSTPIVTYRSNKNHVSPNIDTTSYQHLLNYRGSCGEVDFRYQPLYPRNELTNVESNFRVIPISSLVPIQTLIMGEFGAISLCKIVTDQETQSASCCFVKNINMDSKPVTKASFILDLKILSSLNCLNVAKLEAIAIDNDMETSDLVSIIKSTRFYILMDYLNGCNLKDFLRNNYYSNVTQDFKSNQSLPYNQISFTSLLIIITQISNGMKHFEDLGLTHRDLGCRNCIIDMRMNVKIYPGGLVNTKQNDDYCSIELVKHLVMFPLRWMAPESIIAGIYTTKSDVWSFAVTLWEIFTLCSLVPYGSLTNDALLDLMSHRNNTPRLPCPQSCPKEIFDLMSQCWNWDESMRPKFVEIQSFLQFKMTSSNSQAQIILPAPPPDDKTS